MTLTKLWINLTAYASVVYIKIFWSFLFRAMKWIVFINYDMNHFRDVLMISLQTDIFCSPSALLINYNTGTFFYCMTTLNMWDALYSGLLTRIYSCDNFSHVTIEKCCCWICCLVKSSKFYLHSTFHSNSRSFTSATNQVNQSYGIKSM